jgi:hypothetical protein
MGIGVGVEMGIGVGVEMGIGVGVATGTCGLLLIVLGGAGG